MVPLLLLLLLLVAVIAIRKRHCWNEVEMVSWP